MLGKIMVAGMLSIGLVLSSGCVTPVTGVAQYAGRSAQEQLGIARAAKEALKEPKLEALAGTKVWVDVASISRSGGGPTQSEDEHFLQNIIMEALAERGAIIGEKQQAEAVLRVVAEVIGIDTVSRVWPHYYLPLMYYISHTAHVKVHLYAYDIKDSSMITAADCEGTYAWSEWSVIGLGPFR